MKLCDDSRRKTSRNGSASSSSNSDASGRSRSTAPTVYSDMPSPKQVRTANHAYARETTDSVSTYASTTDSSVDEEEPVPEDGAQYEVSERRHQYFPSDTIPSNAAIFGDLFPSSRRLHIRHDDSTLDGNMNLRVDTVVTRRGGYQQDVSLFHLRMYDLYSRKFSFRRYCRDSGREVCHSSRKPLSSNGDKRQLFRRSWTNVLSTLRPKTNGSSGSASKNNALKRQDSKNRSTNDDDSCFGGEDQDARDGSGYAAVELSDTTTLEFSNYAHVEVRKRGLEGSRYEYEYWATRYQWRRGTRREGDLQLVSYYLVNMNLGKTVAHIVPDILTPLESVEEASKGGWVPPSSMWINDSDAYERMPDIADVIVATGLVILADDCIQRRWHSRRHSATVQSAKSFELMGPGNLFRRRQASC